MYNEPEPVCSNTQQTLLQQQHQLHQLHQLQQTSPNPAPPTVQNIQPIAVGDVIGTLFPKPYHLLSLLSIYLSL